jgi:hypothetical protein
MAEADSGYLAEKFAVQLGDPFHTTSCNMLSSEINSSGLLYVHGKDARAMLGGKTLKNKIPMRKVTGWSKYTPVVAVSELVSYIQSSKQWSDEQKTAAIQKLENARNFIVPGSLESITERQIQQHRHHHGGGAKASSAKSEEVEEQQDDDDDDDKKPSVAATAAADKLLTEYFVREKRKIDETLKQQQDEIVANRVVLKTLLKQCKRLREELEPTPEESKALEVMKKDLGLFESEKKKTAK